MLNKMNKKLVSGSSVVALSLFASALWISENSFAHGGGPAAKDREGDPVHSSKRPASQDPILQRLRGGQVIPRKAAAFGTLGTQYRPETSDSPPMPVASPQSSILDTPEPQSPIRQDTQANGSNLSPARRAALAAFLNGEARATHTIAQLANADGDPDQEEAVLNGTTTSQTSTVQGMGGARFSQMKDLLRRKSSFHLGTASSPETPHPSRPAAQVALEVENFDTIVPRREVREGEFDVAIYLELNPDLETKQDALYHYNHHFASEPGRNVTDLPLGFDSRAYLFHSDLWKGAIQSGLTSEEDLRHFARNHFRKHGYKEKRIYSFPDNFDVNFYTASNLLAIRDYIKENPYHLLRFAKFHWMTHNNSSESQLEHVGPSTPADSFFNPDAYLSYPDLWYAAREAYVSQDNMFGWAKEHYRVNGAQEGRKIAFVRGFDAGQYLRENLTEIQSYIDTFEQGFLLPFARSHWIEVGHVHELPFSSLGIPTPPPPPPPAVVEPAVVAASVAPASGVGLESQIRNGINLTPKEDRKFKKLSLKLETHNIEEEYIEVSKEYSESIERLKGENERLKEENIVILRKIKSRKTPQKVKEHSETIKSNDREIIILQKKKELLDEEVKGYRENISEYGRLDGLTTQEQERLHYLHESITLFGSTPLRTMIKEKMDVVPQAQLTADNPVISRMLRLARNNHEEKDSEEDLEEDSSWDD